MKPSSICEKISYTEVKDYGKHCEVIFIEDLLKMLKLGKSLCQILTKNT